MLSNKAYVPQNPKHCLGPALAYLIYLAANVTISLILQTYLMPPILFYLTLRLGNVPFADPQLAETPFTSTMWWPTLSK